MSAPAAATGSLTGRRRVLLDENLPVQLRSWLSKVDAITVQFMGWKGVRNGALVPLAQAEGFDAFVTADRMLATSRRTWTPLACIHVSSNLTPRVRVAAARIEAACLAAMPGDVVTVEV